MDRTSRAFVLLIVLCLISLTISAGCISDLNPRMFYSSYNYQIQIKHSGPLSNATFIIPLPIRNHTPAVGSYILTRDDFQKENVSVTLTQSPLGLNLSEVVNISGYNPYFLIIRTESPITDASYGDVYTIKKHIELKVIEPDFPIDSLTPIGNESLLVPKYHFSWKEPQRSVSKSMTTIEYQPLSIPQETWIYVDFMAPPSTQIDVYIRMEGHNWWKQYDDASVGNGYSDWFSGIFYGEVHGWQRIKGELTAADGIYPNLSHSEWQKVMNRSV